MCWSPFAAGTFRAQPPGTFPHLRLIYIAISLFSEHFEAQEANLSGQEDLSGGLAHGSLSGVGSMFLRTEILETEVFPGPRGKRCFSDCFVTLEKLSRPL